MIFTIACSRQVYKFDPSVAAYYPPPPDTTRIQFLTSLNGSASIVKKQSGFTRFLVGEKPEKPIIKPYGIASYPGKIYVCDADVGGIEIIDLENNSFEYFIPKGKGKFSHAHNCCIDEVGNLYVADIKRRQIIVFDSSGTYLNSFGEPAPFMPTDIAVSDSIIFVLNMKNHEVIAYDKINFSRLYSFPESETGKQDYLYSPLNMFVDDSIVYISDVGESKIKKYTYDGRFLNSFGSYGRGMGQFVRVKGVAVDRESRIYAVDASFENVQVFNDKNELLMFFGGSTKDPGGMWLPAQVAIDYYNLEYFYQFVDPEYNLEFLIYVTNQFGPNKVNVYGFIKPKIK